MRHKRNQRQTLGKSQKQALLGEMKSLTMAALDETDIDDPAARLVQMQLDMLHKACAYTNRRPEGKMVREMMREMDSQHQRVMAGLLREAHRLDGTTPLRPDTTGVSPSCASCGEPFSVLSPGKLVHAGCVHVEKPAR